METKLLTCLTKCKANVIKIKLDWNYNFKFQEVISQLSDVSDSIIYMSWNAKENKYQKTKQSKTLTESKLNMRLFSVDKVT